ncbi:glutamine-dependent NAD(+) synthetase [Xanthoria parietina]
MIICNGDILACGSQFSLDEVEVVTATIDLEDVRSFRSSPSRGLQSQHAQKYPRINLDVRLSKRVEDHDYQLQGQSEPIDLKYHAPEEEIALGGACWLWDYLRRCRAAGFFIPLSGGIDSCATSVMVFSMCRLVVSAIQEGNEQVLQDARRIAAEADESTWVPETPQELMNRIFCTTYMGSKNSSSDTRRRAKDLARDLGAYHVDIDIDTVTTAIVNVFFSWSNWMPRFKSAGGSFAENLALQNIQARSRMVLAYLFAQLLPTFRGRRGGGSLLVLGSANVDEALRGYLTKYDCSSADVNPIGGISKTDLKRFIDFARTSFDLPILSTFLSAVPTAELEPITSSYIQSDEADMGITYAELSTFGRLRKNDKLGPWGAYSKLLSTWGSQKSKQNPNDQAVSPRQIAEKTKFFFTKYAINRHKMTVLTPSLHMEQYSPDDNRFDLRPFLYPGFDWAYAKIDRDVERREKGESGRQKAKVEDDLD